MRILIEGKGNGRIGEYPLPTHVDVFFLPTLAAEAGETPEQVLARVAEPQHVDESYGQVVQVGSIQLLAEAKDVLKAIKDSLQRRIDNPVVEGERVRFI